MIRLFEILHDGWSFVDRNQGLDKYVIKFSDDIHGFIQSEGMFITRSTLFDFTERVLWIHLDRMCEHFGIEWEQMPEIVDRYTTKFKLRSKMVGDKWLIFRLEKSMQNCDLCKIYRKFTPMQAVGRAFLLNLVHVARGNCRVKVYVPTSLFAADPVEVLPHFKSQAPCEYESNPTPRRVRLHSYNSPPRQC